MVSTATQEVGVGGGSPEPAPVVRRGRARRLTLYVAGICLLAWMVWDSRNQIRELIRAVDMWWFAASLPLGVVMTGCYGGLFALLLNKHGAATTLPNAILIYLESQPGKYVPGRVGSIAMQAMLVSSSNPWLVASLANIELLAVCFLHMLAIGIIFLFTKSPVALVGGALIALLSLWVVQSGGLAGIASLLMRRFRNRTIAAPAARVPLAVNGTLQLCAASLAASATILLLRASGLVHDENLLVVAGVLYLGWAIGTLAFPVPAGLGVREAATILAGTLVSGTLEPQQLIALAVLSRCWQLAVDVLCLLTAAVLRQVNPGPGVSPGG